MQCLFKVNTVKEHLNNYIENKRVENLEANTSKPSVKRVNRNYVDK